MGIVIQKAKTGKVAADKAAVLSAEVAAMNYHQRWARLCELAGTELTPEAALEFAKLLFGSDASVAID